MLERFKAADDNPLLGPDGPNWYRGAASCNECAEADVLRPWLQQVGARRVVLGHTVARNGTVVSRFDGAVVKLDAGMNRAVYRGRPAALISDASGSRVALRPAGHACRRRSRRTAVPQLAAVRRGHRRGHPRARHDQRRRDLRTRRAPDPRHARRAQRRRRVRGSARRGRQPRARGLSTRPAARARHGAGDRRAQPRGTGRRAAGPAGELGQRAGPPECPRRRARRSRLPGDQQHAAGRSRPGVHCRPTARRRACRPAAGAISTPSCS